MSLFPHSTVKRDIVRSMPVNVPLRRRFARAILARVVTPILNARAREVGLLTGRIAALEAREAELTALLDGAWKRAVAYRSPQVCKHLMAADLIGGMEKAGIAVPTWAVKAVVNADDATALGFDREAWLARGGDPNEPSPAGSR